MVAPAIVSSPRAAVVAVLSLLGGWLGLLTLNLLNERRGYIG
jgi:hypothetical protein